MHPSVVFECRTMMYDIDNIFEKYMYFESSSYSSGSLGEFHDNTWPKKSGEGTSLSPYVLYSVSESVAVDV